VNLTVRLFAGLRERAGRAELELADLPEPLDIAALKRELERRLPELGSLASVRCAIGTRYASDDSELARGDEVALIPPVSGGAPDSDEALERGIFELSLEPIDPSACQRRVGHPSCGACALFTGLVRAESRGRRVTRLEYEAFEAMTAAEMVRLFERCRATHGDPDGSRPERRLRLLVRHRVGRVAIGEPSVVVAVASPHRDLAFRACRFLIDELKQSVPIWKKELYEDGEAWIGERS
jgi:MoaE-MoaD fusion protein